MILQQTTFKTGRIQARLQKQQLGISKTYRVHPVVYQSCLRYTLIAKLAPSWNRCGEWFVQGRDFLMHTGYTNAIKMNLNVSHDEVYVSLIGTAVKCPPLQIEDLNLSKREMTEILQSTEGKLREVPVADCWCHVLPSMKTGKICSLSLMIPRESPFSSYKELKRHWKNMYGYRLAETDEDLLYCQVTFLPSGAGKHFTYPSICLRTGPVQPVQRVDPKPILTVFLQDIHSRVVSACGQPLRFQPRIRYTVPSLQSAEQAPQHANLSGRSAHKSAGPLRSSQSMSHLYRTDQSKHGWREKLQEGLLTSASSRPNKTTKADVDRCSFNSDTEQIPSMLGEDRCEMSRLYDSANPANGSSTHPEGSLVRHPIIEMGRSIGGPSSVSPMTGSVQKVSQTQPQPVDNVTHTLCHTDEPAQGSRSSQFKTPTTAPVSFGSSTKAKFLSQSSDASHSTSSEQKVSCSQSQNTGHNVDKDKLPIEKTNSGTKYVPLFRPKPKAHAAKPVPNQQNLCHQISGSGTLVPVFKPKVPKAAMAVGKVERKTSSDTSTREKSALPVVVSSRGGGSDTSSADQNSASHTATHLSQPPALIPVSRSQIKPVREQSTSNISYPYKVAVQPPREAVVSNKCKAITSYQGEYSAVGVAVTSGVKFKHRTSEITEKTMASAVKQSRTPDLLSQSSNGGSEGSSVFETPQIGLKRKKNNEDGVTLQKIRAKPQIQNLDVEALARVGQLSKVNTVSLLAWLRERGVACRTKDKKAQLVDKVQQYLDTEP